MYNEYFLFVFLNTVLEGVNAKYHNNSLQKNNKNKYLFKMEINKENYIKIKKTYLYINRLHHLLH